MSSITKTLLYSLPAIFILIGHVEARHGHHHHIRQTAVAVPIVTIDASPSTTIQATRVTSQASSEVISDLEDIKEGIDDLPRNLFSYIQSVEQRLETVEALLQSLLSNATPTPLAALPTASPAVIASTSRRGPAPYTTIPGVPAGSTPLSTTTLQTSQVTSTRTSIATITNLTPIPPVESSPNLTRPFSYTVLGNGTIATPTAKPASSRSRAPQIMTLTVAVIPVPSTVTLSGLTAAGSGAPTTFATLVRTAT